MQIKHYLQLQTFIIPQQVFCYFFFIHYLTPAKKSNRFLYTLISASIASIAERESREQRKRFTDTLIQHGANFTLGWLSWKCVGAMGQFLCGNNKIYTAIIHQHYEFSIVIKMTGIFMQQAKPTLVATRLGLHVRPLINRIHQQAYNTRTECDQNTEFIIFIFTITNFKMAWDD